MWPNITYIKIKCLGLIFSFHVLCWFPIFPLPTLVCRIIALRSAWREQGGRNMFPYKMGPYQFKWGEITPIRRVISPVITLFTIGSGAHLAY